MHDDMQEIPAPGSFVFSLSDQVVIGCSTESGVVIGRASYLENANSYLVRYKAADGRAVESWWNESALLHANDSVHPLPSDDIPF